MAETPDNPTPPAPADAGAEPTVEQALAEAQDSLAEVQEALDQSQVADVAAVEVEVDAESVAGINLLGDVDLYVTIELGRAQMLIEDVLKLKDGSVVELDKLAGDPVEVYVNGRLVARGEVLVLNDNFCIRIGEIVDNIAEKIESVTQ